MTENAIATKIVDAAFRIHTTLAMCGALTCRPGNHRRHE
jgi:hypothetical protein